jgi:hypothetical protein
MATLQDIALKREQLNRIGVEAARKQTELMQKACRGKALLQEMKEGNMPVFNDDRQCNEAIMQLLHCRNQVKVMTELFLQWHDGDLPMYSEGVYLHTADVAKSWHDNFDERFFLECLTELLVQKAGGENLTKVLRLQEVYENLVNKEWVEAKIFKAKKQQDA